jgi:diaminopimelate epimerase
MVAFIKMHGLGNDFVVLDARHGALALDDAVVRRLGDRRRGVGFDQLLVLEPAQNPDADLFMRIYNPDGSESGACGNGTRCVAALALDESGREASVIETRRGLLHAHVAEQGRVTVDMGAALTAWDDVPLGEPCDTLSLDAVAEGPLQSPTAIGMGNPHCVFFVPDAEAIALETLGPKIEHHPLFPARTNVEVASLTGPDRLRLRVWERGVGITEACGSGACATAVAAVRRGLTGRQVSLDLDGGRLEIEWRERDGHVLMTGPVATSFAGEVSL